MSIDNKGSAPFISKIVKKAAVKKDWKMIKKEQDKIVRYITAQTKNAHFNYIITRPSGAIWDKPSKKKLAASKSVSLHLMSLRSYILLCLRICWLGF